MLRATEVVNGAYRAPMRSRRDDAPEGAGVERALRLGVCGVGGILDPAPSSLDEAVQRASQQLDERLARRIRRFAEVPDGALVWTRDIDGVFWLGRLTGGWRYDASVEAADVDLVHVRDCDWFAAPIADHLVPAPVAATFARGGRNWQRIRHPDAAPLSAALWESQSDRG